jgi:hypothetical protein
LTLTSAGFTLVPGLIQTITVPSNANVCAVTDGAIQTTSASTTGFSRVDVVLTLDGNFLPGGAGFRRVTAANTGGSVTNITYWSFSDCLPLAAGGHTISVFAQLQSGSTATVSGDSTSVLQGQLTTFILKQ